MTWPLLIIVGLVVEAAVIVALGRRVTGGYEPADADGGHSRDHEGSADARPTGPHTDDPPLSVAGRSEPDRPARPPARPLAAPGSVLAGAVRGGWTGTP